MKFEPIYCLHVNCILSNPPGQILLSDFLDHVNFTVINIYNIQLFRIFNRLIYGKQYFVLVQLSKRHLWYHHKSL